MVCVDSVMDTKEKRKIIWRVKNYINGLNSGTNMMNIQFVGPVCKIYAYDNR